jgi:hypothetical protein
MSEQVGAVRDIEVSTRAALETAITALVRDGQKQNQGWTEKDQPQEPEPSRDAEDADRLATLADYVDGGDLKIYHHSWLAKPHDPESGQSVVFVESGARRFEGEPGDSVFAALCNTLDAMNCGAET